MATSAISPVTASTAGNQTPGFCGLGGQSRWLLQRRQAATRNVSPTREGVTQNVLEACLPMTVAAALLLAAASEAQLTPARMLRLRH